MSKTVYKTALFIGSFAIIIASFFGMHYVLALVLSYSAAAVSHYLTVRFINRALVKRNMEVKKLIIYSFFKYSLYSLSIYMFILMPQYGIILCVVFGLLIIQISIHIDNYITRKGGRV